MVLAQEAIAQSGTEIKQAIIEESIRAYKAYKGPCACPYSRTSRGHKCGKRSAYSKPGGASPKCYPEDVTQEEVEEYKAR